MVVQAKQRASLADFEAFIALPENANRLFEFIGGEIIEVPSNPFVSKIAAKISGELYVYLKSNDIGHLTGEAGGYMVNGERYAPDVAFIRYERQPELAEQGYNPNPPDLAVEVISSPGSPEEGRNLRIKVSHYLAAGVTVWVVDPQLRRVEVHQPGQPAQDLDVKDPLTAEGILPGFELPVKDIFPPEKAFDKGGVGT